MATTAPESRAPEQERPAEDSPAGQALTGRAVIWTGLAAGTAITVVAVLHGIRVPGLQVVLSVLATWALLVIGAITAAELLRRHHRALARHAARHGKRGALFTARHSRRGALVAGRGARRGSRSAAGYLTRKAAARWQNRAHRPLLFTRHGGAAPQTPAGTAGPAPAAVTAPTPPPSGTAPGAGSFPPEGKTTMADTTIKGDPASGWGDPLPEAARPRAQQRPGGRITPAHRARHTAARTGGALPAEWAGVIARAADFEPGDDGELLGWMGDEVSGVAGYAEALIDLYESCTSGIGLDPVAMTALHDVADAAAHAAETMSGARHRFADHYELPREFAGNGGLMPHDGRWVTGDGDA